MFIKYQSLLTTITIKSSTTAATIEDLKEEMSIEDQDEEVEEEEEFHEVEEEKHKTSQELVSGGGDRITSPNRQHQNNKDSNAQDQNDPQTTSNSSSSPSRTATTTTSTTTAATITATIAETSTKSFSISEDTKPLDTVETPKDEVKDQSASELEATPNVEDATPTTTVDSSTASSISPVTAATNTNADHANDSKADDGVTSAEANSQSESSKNVDWANIMLTSNRSGDSAATEEDNTTNDDQSSRGISPEVAKEVAIDLEDIIAKTQEKLRINDDSVDSLVVEPTDSKLDLSSLDDHTGTICEDADLNLDDDDNNQEVAASEEKKSEDTNDAAATNEATNEEKSLEKAEEDAKELDLDEDVKNPQYIPKKGVFYEHDDRSHDVEDKKQSTSSDKKGEETIEVKEPSSNKKTAVQEKPTDARRNNRRQRTEADRWNHDLFRDEKQKPKSKTELINAYGYDIRQERSGNQSDSRAQRGNNNISSDKIQPVQENQRSRQNKDGGRRARQEPSGNRSREARPRRQNTRNNANSSNNRSDNYQGSMSKRDGLSGRPGRSENRDLKETNDEKGPTQVSAFPAAKRDQEYSRDPKNTRNDSRGRRRNSRDRPNTNVADDKAPNAMMAPITIWSSEDMAKAEAFKDGPLTAPQQQNLPNNNQRNRTTDLWQQAQPNKNMYQVDKSIKNPENENRQHYNSRGRFQDRVDDTHKANQYTPRNQYGDRSNQHDWHRSNNYSPYNKSNDYIVKTQTFENSRLSQQANMNRSNNRDLREVLNERRMHGNQNHQNYQPKGQLADQQHMHQRGPIPNQLHHQPYVHPQQQQMMHHQPQHMMHPNHPPPQHLQHHQHHHQQSSSPQQQHQLGGAHLHSPHQQQQQQVTPNQQSQPTSHQQAQNQRQPSTSQAQSANSNQTRQNVAVSSGLTDTPGGESSRLTSNVATTASDLLNSRPIIKTETYTTAGLSPHQQQQQQQSSQAVPQHSQNHRNLGGPMGTQQGPNPGGSHMMPSHLGAGGNQPQYYSPSNNSRDQTAAALASAYHGYIPGGHPVMDTSRYHMTSQQLPDHGYMPSPGQTNVASAPVLHQQGMYSDATTAGGTVASSAYMAQAGSTLSPTSNIPVTGAGPPPLPPYLQHSQYPPPPYSNPYSQPQHNQAPPQSNHAYPPYWSYI